MLMDKVFILKVIVLVYGKIESENLNFNDDWEVRSVLFELCVQWIYR